MKPYFSWEDFKHWNDGHGPNALADLCNDKIVPLLEEIQALKQEVKTLRNLVEFGISATPIGVVQTNWNYELQKCKHLNESCVEENARLRKALEFYAYPRSWLRELDDDVARRIVAEDCDEVANWATYCGGKMARAALGETTLAQSPDNLSETSRAGFGVSAKNTDSDS